MVLDEDRKVFCGGYILAGNNNSKQVRKFIIIFQALVSAVKIREWSVGWQKSSETIFGKMVREALLGGISVKTRMVIANQVKVCKGSIAGRENSKNKDPEVSNEHCYVRAL